ncbi:hypothetical protein H257_02537, partial [Aphanomyces astaci]
MSMQLLSVDVDEQLTVNPEAVRFLNESYDALTVLSFHGTKNSGKSALLREILQASEPTEGEQSDGATHPADVAAPPADISGVWMYVQETTYAHAKRVVYLDVQCYGDNEGLDARLFGIVSFLSSNVIHGSVGHINEHVFDEMNFLQSAVHVLGDRPGLLPALTWIVRDLSSKDVKAAVPSADPASDIDQQYLEAVLNPKSSPFTSSLSWQILTSFFPKRIGAILPPTSSPAYSKKVLRVRKSLVEPSHVKEVRGVALHGSIFCHVMALLCASPSNITSEVWGPKWDDVLRSDMLHLVEVAFDVYKSTVDTSICHDGHTSPPHHDDRIEFPCDEGDVKTLHVAGKAAAQPFLAKAGALGDDLAALAARLFHELSAAHVAKWMDENDRASSAQCLSVLQRLHTDIEHLIKAKLQPQDDNNPLRLVDFKAILRAYQHSVQNMVVEYASEAVGPQKMAALSQFFSTVVPRFIEYLVHLGDQTMHRQTALVEQVVVDGEATLADAVQAKAAAMEAIKSSQRQVQAKLVANLHLETRIKQVLQDAVDDVTDLHDQAKVQGESLETQAFNNVRTIVACMLVETVTGTIVGRADGGARAGGEPGDPGRRTSVGRVPDQTRRRRGIWAQELEAAVLFAAQEHPVVRQDQGRLRARQDPQGVFDRRQCDQGLCRRRRRVRSVAAVHGPGSVRLQARAVWVRPDARPSQGRWRQRAHLLPARVDDGSQGAMGRTSAPRGHTGDSCKV